MPGDYRFSARGDTEISVFLMTWPTDNKVLIKSLASQPDSKAAIEKVELYGHPGELTFTQTAEGLSVRLPAEQPCDFAWTLRVTGKNLRDFKLKQ